MATPILPDVERESPFSAADRAMHVTKYAERSFGAPIGDIGTVETDGSSAWLVVTVDGTAYKLRWARQPNGSIFWFVDGDDRPLTGGPSSRGLAQLRHQLAQR
jgi:hypothetical protein